MYCMDTGVDYSCVLSTKCSLLGPNGQEALLKNKKKNFQVYARRICRLVTTLAPYGEC